MKKTLLTLGITLLTAIGAWAQTTFTVNNLTYTVTDETTNTVELTGYENRPIGAISIPASVSYRGVDYTMASIGEKAFENCNALTLVTIFEGVTTIKQEAFSKCSILTEVRMPASITSIGHSAFATCNELTKANIPEGVTTIENRTFYFCPSLTQVTLPNSLTSIGENAFSICSALTTITIPDNVTTIGNRAFSYCDALTTITIPNNVTTIGESAFSSCEALTTVNIGSGLTNMENVFNYCPALTQINVDAANTAYSSENGVLFNKDKTALILYPIGKTETTYTVPDGVTAIGNNAFESNSVLTQITLPESLTSVGNSAFNDCPALTQITLPENVASIGYGAFTNCTALTQITILATVPPTVEPYALEGIDIPVYVPATALADYLVADGWKELAQLQAIGATNFTVDNLKYTVTDETAKTVELTGYETEPTGTLNIPATVTYASTNYNVTGIKKKAFENCTELTTVTIANGVTTIGEYAFSNCDALTQITLPESLTTIGESVFIGCDALTTITIPANVTSIGNFVFAFCPALTQINVDEANTAYSSENGVLFNKDKTALIHYPIAKTETDYTVPASVTTIKTKAFFDCTTITQITLPEHLAIIESEAFYNCNAFTQMTVLATVPPTIENTNAFYSVSHNIPVYVPVEALEAYKAADIWKTFNTLLAIGTITFTVDKLTYTISDVLANTVEVTGYESGWAGNVNIPATVTYEGTTYTVTSIGKNAFYSCEAITAVTIPESVTSIGKEAFTYCTALTQITLPNNLTEIGENAFKDCSALTTITIPASVTTIRSSAFINCAALTQINVNAANTAYCSENGILFNKDKTTLVSYPAGKTDTTYTVPNSVTIIGENAFIDCTALTQITLPESLTDIEESAFLGCSSFTQMTVKAIVPPTIEYRNAFTDVRRNIPVYVPAEAVEAYKAADIWEDFIKLQAIQTGLQTVVLPESIRMEGGILHNPQQLHLTLYDMQGHQVYSGNDTTLSLTTGVYVMHCEGASCKVLF